MKVKHTVWEEYFGYETGFRNFVEMMQEFLERIPREYRDDAKFDWQIPEFDGGSGKIEVYYYRPETALEIHTREQWKRKYEADCLEDEKRQYERLKAKFGNG